MEMESKLRLSDLCTTGDGFVSSSTQPIKAVEKDTVAVIEDNGTLVVAHKPLLAEAVVDLIESETFPVTSTDYEANMLTAEIETVDVNDPNCDQTQPQPQPQQGIVDVELDDDEARVNMTIIELESQQVQHQQQQQERQQENGGLTIDEQSMIEYKPDPPLGTTETDDNLHNASTGSIEVIDCYKNDITMSDPISTTEKAPDPPEFSKVLFDADISMIRLHHDDNDGNNNEMTAELDPPEFSHVIFDADASIVRFDYEQVGTEKKESDPPEFSNATFNADASIIRLNYEPGENEPVDEIQVAKKKELDPPECASMMFDDASSTAHLNVETEESIETHVPLIEMKELSDPVCSNIVSDVHAPTEGLQINEGEVVVNECLWNEKQQPKLPKSTDALAELAIDISKSTGLEHLHSVGNNDIECCSILKDISSIETVLTTLGDDMEEICDMLVNEEIINSTEKIVPTESAVTQESHVNPEVDVSNETSVPSECAPSPAIIPAENAVTQESHVHSEVDTSNENELSSECALSPAIVITESAVTQESHGNHEVDMSIETSLPSECALSPAIVPTESAVTQESHGNHEVDMSIGTSLPSECALSPAIVPIESVVTQESHVNLEVDTSNETSLPSECAISPTIAPTESALTQESHGNPGIDESNENDLPSECAIAPTESAVTQESHGNPGIDASNENGLPSECALSPTIVSTESAATQETHGNPKVDTSNENGLPSECALSLELLVTDSYRENDVARSGDQIVILVEPTAGTTNGIVTESNVDPSDVSEKKSVYHKHDLTSNDVPAFETMMPLPDNNNKKGVSNVAITEYSVTQALQSSFAEITVDDDDCSYEEIVVDDDDEFIEYADEIFDDEFTEQTFDSQNDDVDFIINANVGFNGNVSRSSMDDFGCKRPVIKSATQKALEKEVAVKTAEAEEVLENVTFRLARQNSFCRKDDEYRKQLEIEEEEHLRQEEEQERKRVAEHERQSQLNTEKAKAFIDQQEEAEMRQRLYDEEIQRQAMEVEAQRHATEQAAREKEFTEKVRREAEEREKLERDAKRKAMEDEVRLLQAKLAEAKVATEAAKMKQMEEKLRLKAKVEAHRKEKRRSSVTGSTLTNAESVPVIPAEAICESDSKAEVAADDTEPTSQPKIATSTSNSVYYPIDVLRKQSVPGLDYKNREIYIHPDEFQKLFLMSIEEFNEQPKWKRTNLKRKQKLF